MEFGPTESAPRHGTAQHAVGFDVLARSIEGNWIDMKRPHKGEAGAAIGLFTEKRQEIIDGARRVFLDMGFDGASINEIARASAVSKGTIYSYFTSKEELFAALVEADRTKAAECLFDYDSEEPDVERTLRRIGETFMLMMVQPDHIRLTRLVIGAAEKFPVIGRTFFDAGPREGSDRLADLLARLTQQGYLAIDDCEIAAFQFFNLCQGNIVRKLMFGVEQLQMSAAVESTVRFAVGAFLRAYGTGSPRRT
ncbi:TetR/AcrR family transcriptional regulator [Bradyrhizobium barranii subsp. apii]|uniref:TetR/AcrR family transcriptional regulator n=1 Tax=Bradyrhizobium barranii TaxID=2992140 RepID=UPI001CD430D3|nr:TetR/AcrR family transcriptional regulator [Bradyrhizobium barranii]UPT95051.1 TetR/AcrR family transcriptional regulator [Bradyrhizobium barranii subsp. apii]